VLRRDSAAVRAHWPLCVAPVAAVHRAHALSPNPTILASHRCLLSVCSVQQQTVLVF